jgi:FkbM family methyltransferase
MPKSPLTLIDVGASGALPVRWRGLADKADIIGFDPDERSAESLKPKPGLRYRSIGLYSRPGTMRLFLTRKQECSSFFSPNRRFLDGFPESERFDVIGTQEVTVDTLDRQVIDAGIEDPDLVKLDVQGAELAVLEGGLETLKRRLFGVQIEVCFVPLYEGQPLFSHVDIFLRDLGFDLFDLSGEFWKRGPVPMPGSARGQLIFAEALYFKTADATRAMVAEILEGDRAGKVLKAVTIASMYGFQDHGIHVLEGCRDFVDAALFASALRALSSQVPLQRRLPDFPGRRVAAGLAYQAYRLLRPRYWADYPTRYNRG